MEDRLGVVMFERSSSGVLLTTAGTEILRTSRHLVDRLAHMMALVKAVGRGAWPAGHRLLHLALGTKFARDVDRTCATI